MAGISSSVNITDNMTGPLNRITASLYNTTAAFGELDRASDTAFNASAVQAITQELYGYDQRVQELESDLVRANNRIDEMAEETRQARAQVSQLESAFGKIGSVIAGLGIGILIKNQIASAVEYASDLTEVQNVVDVTFRDAAESINDWSKTTLDAFGLSELSAKQYAGTMGAMLKSSGITGDAIEDMSTSITELSGDMASFYNLDTDAAFEKIRSGISGETEPLKQLGINMSVANLEAFALSQGINTAYSEMSQAEQTMLRYNYLIQSTADAQGDFARTSNSYANQTRLLKENWQAFAGELANNLLPVLTQGIQMLNSGVEFMSNNWSVIQPIMLGLLTILGAYITALVLFNAVKMASSIASGIHTVALAAEQNATFLATASQYGFNAALLACPITWIVVAIIAAIAVIIALANHIANTGDVATSAFGVIMGGIYVVGALFKNLGLTVANIALGIWEALGACATNIGVAFGNAISGIQSWLYNLLSTALTVISGICEALNNLPFVEFDYSGITGAASDYAEKSAESAANKNSFTDVGEAFNSGMYTFGAFGDGWAKNAYAAGASWGDGISERVSDKFSAGESAVYDSTVDSAYTSAGAGSLADSAANTAANTSDIADAVDITNENLKYLRDAAEANAVNRFTTAEINVEMVNNNNISSDIDLDGIINTLTTGVQEALEVSAEGVY